MKLLSFKRHSLQLRILIFFLIVDIVLSGILGLAGLFNTSRVNQLYNTRVKEETSDFTTRMKENSVLTQSMVTDYSVWDDTYDYLLGKLPNFPAENISKDSLSTFRADALWLYKNDFSLATQFSLLKDTPNLGLQKQEITKALSDSYDLHFYTETKDGVLEVFGSNVVRSEDYEHKNIPAGYLFVGRIINDKSLAKLKGDNVISARLLAPDKINDYPTRYPVREGTIVFNVPIKDINSRVIGYTYVKIRAASLHEMDLLSTRLLWFNVLTFLTFIIVTFIFMWRKVIKPLDLVRDSLETNSSARLQELMTEETEFGKIAKMIELSIQQEKNAAKELVEREKLLARLVASNTEIEQTNKVMIGRELKMIELKQELAKLKGVPKKDSDTQLGNINNV